jgi:hypothetical protein
MIKLIVSSSSAINHQLCAGQIADGKTRSGRSKSFAPEDGTALALWPLTAVSRILFGKINPGPNPVRER